MRYAIAVTLRPERGGGGGGGDGTDYTVVMRDLHTDTIGECSSSS